ncbi:carbon-nitrogen hydrolase family protein [Synergistaceae bacterium OttesenSCG-928-D05]|nr:carbon-nitrogen hydrolase family protein [Synergistaceae bacterium OttesenSCG-928-D05]
MRKWKITVGQLAPKQADCTANAKKAAEILKECAAVGSKLLVLPELYLSGYEIAETIKDPAKKSDLQRQITQNLTFLWECTRETGVDLLVSYPLFEANAEKPFIALEYIAKGQTLAVHKKINLCNYAQYTEHLTFSAGDEVVAAKTENGTAGLFVCEDLWHVTNAIFAAKIGAEALFYPSAATVIEKADGNGCLSNWKKITVGTAFTQTSFVVCCNQAASESTMYFGGSHVVGPDGEIIAQLPLFEEAVEHVELDMDYLEQIRNRRPLLANERFEVYRKLV